MTGTSKVYALRGSLGCKKKKKKKVFLAFRLCTWKKQEATYALTAAEEVAPPEFETLEVSEVGNCQFFAHAV